MSIPKKFQLHHGLNRTSIKWDFFSQDVLPAWVAEMDFPLAPPIKEKLLAILNSSDTGYPSAHLEEELRTVFIERMQAQFDWTPSDLPPVYFQDAVQAIFHVVDCFTQKGDKLLTLTPIYPPFLEVGEKLDRPCSEIELSNINGVYRIPWDELRTAAKGARMLLLCNPHNPTGRVFSKSELQTLAEIVLENNLIVVADEIHADLIYTPHEHIPFAQISPEINAQTITLTSATKAFNLGGLRCAILAFGHIEQQKLFAKRPWQIRGGLNIMGIHATISAWRDGNTWLRETMKTLEQNRETLVDYIQNRLPEIICAKPQATYLAWLDCRNLNLGDDPAAHFLEHGKLGLSSGTFFGKAGAGFARLNFATSPTILNEALRRLEQSVKNTRG
ncbi:MAG: PatB family C-S lyase [Myxococcota bacterium]|nr:PatB family C-S lyase [Myxococcota bacterium]